MQCLQTLNFLLGRWTKRFVASRVCGVQSFYSPRSHPGCRAVTIHCVDPGTINSVTTKKVDGVNWENTFSKQRQNEGDVAKG